MNAPGVDAVDKKFRPLARAERVLRQTGTRPGHAMRISRALLADLYHWSGKANIVSEPPRLVYWESSR